MTSRNNVRRIGLIPDAHLNRDRIGIVLRSLQSIGRNFTIRLLPKSTTEAELIERLKTDPFDAILIPWKSYLAWTTVDSQFGIYRTDGPTFIGYMGEPVAARNLGTTPKLSRLALLDLYTTTPTELTAFLRTIVDPSARFGLRSLFLPKTILHTQSWKSDDLLGPKLDSLSDLPELNSHPLWRAQLNRIRCVVSSLWSMHYEEGPGRIVFGQPENRAQSKIFFQVALDANLFAIRYCMQAPGLSTKQLIESVWPDETRPQHAFQLAGQLADFLRIRPVLATSDVEIVVGFFPSSPAVHAPSSARSIWIEPITSQQIVDIPFERTDVAVSQIRSLTARSHSSTSNDTSDVNEIDPISIQIEAKDLALKSASSKIRSLQKAITERDERFQELREGGVGSAEPLPPPDTDSLIQAFRLRLTETDQKIEQLRQRITTLGPATSDPRQLQALEQEISQLTEQQRKWLLELSQTVSETFGKTSRRKSKAAGG